MRPDLFVAMAAYGDYAPGYIGTEVAYAQGGYETGPHASLVAPRAEPEIMRAMDRLLREAAGNAGTVKSRLNAAAPR
jgi:hypothetical protein